VLQQQKYVAQQQLLQLAISFALPACGTAERSLAQTAVGFKQKQQKENVPEETQMLLGA
jgi:hypothetical protein